MSCLAVRYSREYIYPILWYIEGSLSINKKGHVYFQSHLFNLCTAIANCIYCMEFQVASFLYYEEKMNVLVEPDVHDIFARIPGFGFIQTFYSQDTR